MFNPRVYLASGGCWDYFLKCIFPTCSGVFLPCLFTWYPTIPDFLERGDNLYCVILHQIMSLVPPQGFSTSGYSGLRSVGRRAWGISTSCITWLDETSVPRRNRGQKRSSCAAPRPHGHTGENSHLQSLRRLGTSADPLQSRRAGRICSLDIFVSAQSPDRGMRKKLCLENLTKYPTSLSGLAERPKALPRAM